jgi:hypothetical protein
MGRRSSQPVEQKRRLERDPAKRFASTGMVQWMPTHGTGAVDLLLSAAAVRREQVEKRIERLCAEFPRYGCRRITAQLHSEVGVTSSRTM